MVPAGNSLGLSRGGRIFPWESLPSHPSPPPDPGHNPIQWVRFIGWENEGMGNVTVNTRHFNFPATLQSLFLSPVLVGQSLIKCLCPPSCDVYHLCSRLEAGHESSELWGTWLTFMLWHPTWTSSNKLPGCIFSSLYQGDTLGERKNKNWCWVGWAEI